MSSKIKQITIKNESTNNLETISAAISQIYYNNKNNLNIVTDSTDVGTDGKGGKINIESASDIQFKPGDDIILYSHHRPEGSQNEVAVKVTDGEDLPVKLQLNTSEITLTTKDKTGSDSNVMDITVNSAKGARGYLKVRAQAIDLRSESHGGIALQPKGFDGSATDADKTNGEHMNKIKFEHGGGDGLEFGTFNTKKTSLYTDEYRFKKDGIWKMATRTLLDNSTKTTNDGADGKGNGKKDANDPTTFYSYKKQSDDFYDVIDSTDETCTTHDIIKTAYALNGTAGVNTSITNNNNVQIKTKSLYQFIDVYEADEEYPSSAKTPIECENIYHFTDGDIDFSAFTPNIYISYTDISMILNNAQELSDDDLNSFMNISDGNYFVWKFARPDDVQVECGYFLFKKIRTPSINIESDNDIKLEATGKIELKGTIDFGKTFNFGETETAINVNKKLTSKGNKKNCDVLKVQFTNNSASAVTPSEADYNVASSVNFAQEVAAGATATVASCSIYDIIKLVNHFKTNNLGPWATVAAE